MTKAELLARVHRKQEGAVSMRRLERIIDDAFDEMARSLRRGRSFTYPGFGTFVRRRRRAYRGFNPRTQKPIVVPPGVTVGFRPAARLRDVVAGRK